MYIAAFSGVIVLTVLSRFLEFSRFTGFKPSQHDDEKQGTDKTSSSHSDFFVFQHNYLVVYLLAVAADWLQGPYVYALYTHYGYTKKDVGQLYIAGFASSAIFGTFVASIADKFGRRNNAILYSVTYILSCITKHSPQFYTLLVGRLLGGVAYSILFSAFESWMVFEHTNRGFETRLLSATFSKAQFGNGVVAIFSGLVAGWLADRFGKVMPFDASILVLTILMLIISFTWVENYGDSTQSVHGGFARAWSSLISDERILLLGMTQAAFESAMYMFTFVWTPALQNATGQGKEIPHGTIFATFMAATMMGSSIFSSWSRYQRVEVIMRNVFVCAVSVFGIALLSDSVGVMYLAFVIFELLCGIYFPGMATMRAPYIPEESRSALLTFFRVPLNVIVVIALYEDLELNTVFAMCSVLMVCAAISQQRLTRLARHAPQASPGTPVKV